MEAAKYSTYEVRVRAVRAVLNGQPKTVVAVAYQVDYSTLYRWCQRYDEKKGLETLERQPGSGRPALFDAKARERVVKTVLKPASSFGYETDFWTCRRLIQVARKHLRIRVSQPTMWRVLRDVGLTYQKPERRYFEADDEQREHWVRYEVPRIRRVVKKHRAILYFEDESNISLTAVLGKTWAPKGQTPSQKVTGNRGGVAAMSAITPAAQMVFQLHDRRIRSAEVIEFLQQLLKHHPRRHLVLVMDQALPHTSKKTKAFIASQKRLHVFYLPARSPDWNPDEQVWNHLKHQALKGHQAKTKQELQRLATRKLRKMSKDPSLLNGIFFRCCIANLLN